MYEICGGFYLSCLLDYIIAVASMLTIMHATRKRDIKFLRYVITNFIIFTVKIDKKIILEAEVLKMLRMLRGE